MGVSPRKKWAFESGVNDSTDGADSTFSRGSSSPFEFQIASIDYNSDRSASQHRHCGVFFSTLLGWPECWNGCGASRAGAGRCARNAMRMRRMPGFAKQFPGRLQSRLPTVDPDPAAAVITMVTPEAAATAPLYAVNALVNEYGYRWGSFAPGNPAVVTYSFLTSVPGYYASADERNNFVAMNGAQQQAARDAFAMFAEVANITFVEVAPAPARSISAPPISAAASADGPTILIPAIRAATTARGLGDVWITNRYAGYNNPIKGSWQYKPSSTRSAMRSG